MCDKLGSGDMIISKISSNSVGNFRIFDTTKKVSNNYVNKPIANDTVEFKSKGSIESFIVRDLANYQKILNNSRAKFDPKLVEKGADMRVHSTIEGGINKYVINNPERNEVIKIDIDSEKYDYIKPGFVIGKTGFIATLEVAWKNGKNFIIEMHPESELHIDGLDVVHTKLDKLKEGVAFKGNKATATINACYKSEKTVKSVQRFYKLIKNPEFFNSIEKTLNSYKEKFHACVLAGGLGSRLEGISYGREDNKPSTSTPFIGMDLMHLSLLNLFQAGLLPESTDDVDFVIQDEATSAVGCVVTTLGYKLLNDLDGVDLIKEGKSILPKDKSLLIVPSDNIIDIDMTKVLDSYLATENAGMMIVGVPDPRCYGGLIKANENNEIQEFLYKPNAEDIEKRDGYIYSVNSAGEKEYLLSDKNEKTALSNAFIYIINPEIIDTIANIYKNSIRTKYQKELWENKAVINNLTDKQYLKVIEAYWDKEIIPELVRLSNNGRLKNGNGDELKVFVYKDLNVDYSDVGECESYLKTVRKVASKDSYKNLPEVIKKGFADNIDDNVIFNTDAKSEFYELLGDGYTKGNVIILPCE